MTGIGNAGGIEAAPGYRPQQSDQEGTEGKPKLESVEKQPEVSEAAQSMERATFKPEEKVETERSVQESEDLEEAFSAAMEEPKPSEAAEAAPAATEDGGRKTEEAVETAADGGPRTVDQEAATRTAIRDGGQETESGELRREDTAESAPEVTLEEAPEAGRMTVDAPTSGAETVMIDTVPLPESPVAEIVADRGPETEMSSSGFGLGLSVGSDVFGKSDAGTPGVSIADVPETGGGEETAGADDAVIDDGKLETEGASETAAERGPGTEDREAIIDSNDGTGQEAIGTWPTPDSPEAIIDSNDGVGREAIDTVPLPESPEAIFDSHDETSRETIGTWPTPDSGEDPAVVADFRVETESPTPPADPGSGASPNFPEADLSYPDQGPDFEAAQDLEADQSENDQLANLDIQNTLQHQQQLINMLQGMASALQNTRDAIDRKADDGSYQAEVQEDSGREIRVDNAVSLSSELQNAVDQTARMQELMSNIMLKLETSSDQRVQNLKDGETNPETSSMELALETDQGSDSTSVSTEFEDFDQKANQLFSILSTALKNMQEAESAIKRNLDGGDPENEQPQESPTESSPVIAKFFMEYNRELAGIVQQAETALGDTGETETGESSGGNPDHPNTNPAGDGDPGFDQVGDEPITAEFSTELEGDNISEISSENTDLGTAPSQTELNALEAELSAVDQDLAKFAAKVEAINELKIAVREEISYLQEELMDWPDDGSTREITYSDWIQNADGSFTGTEYTKTMTKEEAQNLVEKLEALLETLGDQSQMDMMKLQDAMNAQAQLMQMMSNLSKMFNDTAMAIVRNLK